MSEWTERCGSTDLDPAPDEPEGSGRSDELVKAAPAQFSRDHLIAYAVSAAAARFTLTLHDLRRALGGARQSDRTNLVQPKTLEAAARSLDGPRRRQAKLAGKNLFKRLKAHFERLLTVESASATPEQPTEGVRYPHPEEQVVAWVFSLIGPEEVGEIARSFAKDCQEDPEVAHYALAYAQWQYRLPLEDRIGKSLVPAATAAFEELLAALLRLWLTLYPQALDIDKTNMPVGEARGYQGREDIIRAAVDNKVRELLRGSPQDWDELLKKRRGIELRGLTDSWDDICEVFARRHVLVHWGGRVDTAYLNRLPRGVQRPTLGTQLTTDAAYVKRAISLLENLGASLAVRWLAELLPKGPLPAEFAADHLYAALREQRLHDALVIAEAVVKGRDLDVIPPVVRANWMMARRDSGQDGPGLVGEIEAWQPPADDHDYEIAKASLLRDEGTIVPLLKDIERRSPRDLRRLADWPLLVDMARHSTQVAELLRRAQNPAQRLVVRQRRKKDQRR